MTHMYASLGLNELKELSAAKLQPNMKYGIPSLNSSNVLSLMARSLYEGYLWVIFIIKNIYAENSLVEKRIFTYLLTYATMYDFNKRRHVNLHITTTLYISTYPFP